MSEQVESLMRVATTLVRLWQSEAIVALEFQHSDAGNHCWVVNVVPESSMFEACWARTQPEALSEFLQKVFIASDGQVHRSIKQARSIAEHPLMKELGARIYAATVKDIKP